VNRRGLTLLEILVAVMIFSLAAVAIIQIFAGGLRSITISEDQVAAVTFAQKAFDEAMLDVQLGEGTHHTVSDEDYDVEIEIIPVEEERTAITPFDLQEVNLTLKWTRGRGRRVYRMSGLRIVPRTLR
jgi:prepilin-type N-terminal cleavage/methylation domain-containing protein